MLQAANPLGEISLQVRSNLRHIELLHRIISSGNTEAVPRRQHKLMFSTSHEKFKQKSQPKRS